MLIGLLTIVWALLGRGEGLRASARVRVCPPCFQAFMVRGVGEREGAVSLTKSASLACNNAVGGPTLPPFMVSVDL